MAYWAFPHRVTLVTIWQAPLLVVISFINIYVQPSWSISFHYVSTIEKASPPCRVFTILFFQGNTIIPSSNNLWYPSFGLVSIFVFISQYGSGDNHDLQTWMNTHFSQDRSFSLFLCLQELWAIKDRNWLVT